MSPDPLFSDWLDSRILGTFDCLWLQTKEKKISPPNLLESVYVDVITRRCEDDGNRA